MRIPANTSIGFKPNSVGLAAENFVANSSKVAIVGCRSPLHHLLQVEASSSEIASLSLCLIDKNKSTLFRENSNVSKLYRIFFF